MKNATYLRLVLGPLVLLGACKGPAPPSDPNPPTDPKPAAAEAVAASAPVAAASGDAASSAVAALNQLDPRRPVPLQAMMAWHQKQSMQDHLLVVQEITEALGKEDWEGIVQSAARIESSPEEAQMCRHMGAGAEGFVEVALEFHKRADAIAPAARAKDTGAVLAALSQALLSCTECHAAYRQDLVSAEKWDTLTGSAHEPSKHGPAMHEPSVHEPSVHEPSVHDPSVHEH